MGFLRQEYWSGLPYSPPGDLPDPGIKPVSPASPALQADSLLSELPGTCSFIHTYIHTHTHTHIKLKSWTFFFFSSTSLLLPTHLPPPSCTHAQSCNPMDFSPPDSSVHGFFQARILEWGAISFSKNLEHFWTDFWLLGFVSSVVILLWDQPCGSELVLKGQVFKTKKFWAIVWVQSSSYCCCLDQNSIWSKISARSVPIRSQAQVPAASFP